MGKQKSLIVGNWKMYHNVHQSSLLMHRLEETVEAHNNVEAVVAPNMLSLQSISLQLNRRKFKLAAQNCYWRDEGAYTGEVSAAQLRGVADYVIIGHSERRNIFGERDRDIRQKVQAVLRNDMQPILCIGETASQRADNETEQVIQDQLTAGLANVTSEEIARVVIAYEPVWAIGTGQNATARDVEKVAAWVHKQVAALYGKKADGELRILYGGSVDDENAEIYLDSELVDGLLVGGASLNSHVFANIIEIAHNKDKNNSK